jgi:hypothetical protein
LVVVVFVVVVVVVESSSLALASTTDARRSRQKTTVNPHVRLWTGNPTYEFCYHTRECATHD